MIRLKNYAEKAQLCPKTGELRKVDTWIYLASAILGMPANTSEDREALLKALRGLNRSPFKSHFVSIARNLV